MSGCHNNPHPSRGRHFASCDVISPARIKATTTSSSAQAFSASAAPRVLQLPGWPAVQLPCRWPAIRRLLRMRTVERRSERLYALLRGTGRHDGVLSADVAMMSGTLTGRSSGHTDLVTLMSGWDARKERWRINGASPSQRIWYIAKITKRR